jgi:uncharacterized protein
MTKQIRQSTIGERPAPGGRRIEMAFRVDGDPIPAVLLLPDGGPSAAALLLHGFGSRKEVMADSFGAALLERGIASLAIDMPLHGGRGDPLGRGFRGSPLEILKHWRLAREKARLALHYLAAHRALDGQRLAVAGYSMGSYLGLDLAAAEGRVRAVIVAAGGDLPAHTPFAAMARLAADPTRAVKKLAGRPLLIVHGRRDRTVLPEQAERLYHAAAEPREIRWYDAAHVLPLAAAAEAADWLAERL